MLKDLVRRSKKSLKFQILMSLESQPLFFSKREFQELFRDKDVIGEITIVIKSTNKKNDLNLDRSIIKKDLNDLINAGLSLSAASKYLAKKNGLKKSEIYNLI